MKTIEYYIERVYGREQRYVVDSEYQKAITALTGTRTLCDYQIPPLKFLGYDFKEVVKPRK